MAEVLPTQSINEAFEAVIAEGYGGGSETFHQDAEAGTRVTGFIGGENGTPHEVEAGTRVTAVALGTRVTAAAVSPGNKDW